MDGETEPAKLLLPYLQRADELQKHEPLVSYYCRLYAMDRGLKIPQIERTKTTSALLVSLMKQLEKDKKSLKLGLEDNLYVEGFASNVFAKADKQDRAGRADLNNAKTFYAASIFFEILYQFGELQPEIEQKQKYAVWKAAEIRKALKEGRRPEPGPPGGDKDLSVPSSSPADTYDLGSSESFPTGHPGGDTSSQHADKDLGRTESFPASFSGADSSSQHANLDGALHAHPLPSSYSTPDYPSGDLHQLPPANTPEISVYPQPYHHQPYSGEQHFIPEHYYPPEILRPSISFPNFQSYPSFHDSTFPAAPSHQPTCNQSVPPASSYPSTTSSTATCTYINYQPPVEKITEAHKAARFAVGALAFDDVPVAVDFLRRALELLTNPSAETR